MMTVSSSPDRIASAALLEHSGFKRCIYDSGVNSYQETFSKLFNFYSWLNKRSSTESETLVLDLMSGTNFIRQLHMHGLISLSGHIVKGIAVGLADTRTRSSKMEESKMGIYTITSKFDDKNNRVKQVADISAPWTFRAIKSKQNKHHITNNFDLIVCRGAGAIEDYILPERDVYMTYLLNSTSLLAQGGVFLSQLDPRINALLPFINEEFTDRGFMVRISPGKGERNNTIDSIKDLTTIKIIKK